MVERLTNTDKFELWEKNGLKIYYGLRDIDLHYGCIKEIMVKIQESIDEKVSEDFNVEALKKAVSLLREKIDVIRETMDKVELTVDRVSPKYK